MSELVNDGDEGLEVLTERRATPRPPGPDAKAQEYWVRFRSRTQRHFILEDVCILAGSECVADFRKNESRGWCKVQMPGRLQPIRFRCSRQDITAKPSALGTRLK